jgi:hypothetical protein
MSPRNASLAAAFVSGAGPPLAKPPPEHQVYLAHVGNVEEPVESQVLHSRIGLFEGLPRSRLHRSFAVLHEARRQGPETITRLDGPTAEQDPFLPLRDAPCDDLGVLVMDRTASIAYIPWQRVPRWNARSDPCPALAAKVHSLLCSRAMSVEHIRSAESC